MHRKPNQTLLEQFQFSESEIRNRLKLVGLEQEDIKVLSKLCPAIEDNIKSLVEAFYEVQLSIDEIAILIGDLDTLYHLKNAQKQYILDIFSGNYNGQYINNRLRIGMVHKRIGVEPKLYLSAISTLKYILFDKLAELLSEKEYLQATEALDKLFYFDTTLVFDAYIGSMISEIELAQKKTQDYANSLEQTVAERTAQLEELARQDCLTGLLNQRAMRELFKQVLASAKRRENPISVVYLDNDLFKEINDEFGHIRGDEVLKKLGYIIQHNVRESDIACRYGGDEFCIIQNDTTKKTAKSLCNRIIEDFHEAYPDFTLSIGIHETGPENFEDPDTLISKADKKMYESKKKKGSHIQV